MYTCKDFTKYYLKASLEIVVGFMSRKKYRMKLLIREGHPDHISEPAMI